MSAVATLDDQAQQRAAELLAEHRRTGAELIELPEAIRPTNVADAYAVQDRLVELLIGRHGGTRIGYKVACTNRIAQDALQVDGPLFGQLLGFSTSTSPAQLDASAFTRRIIECEFGFRLDRDVPPSITPYTAATIAAFVGAVVPAIEVVDHRFRDWSLGAPSIVADNAIHGHWVHGAPFVGDWRSLDLADHELKARVDGALVGAGTGAAVLGHPLNVLAWLADELPRYGHRLEAGQFVTTGVCTDVFAAEPGSMVQGDFGALGLVSLFWNDR